MHEQLKFYDNWKICLEPIVNGLEPRDTQDVVVRNKYSLVSAGTELMLLNGEFGPLSPDGHEPGYGSVGEIVGVGSEVKDLKHGDRVFTHGKHASLSYGHVFVSPIPEDISDFDAILARMAQVAMTPIRVARPELGDFAVVQGLGLVGNITAQLLALTGCRVIGIDVSQRRLQALEESAVEFVVDASRDDPIEAVADITGGELADVVVEASGIANLANVAVQMAGKNGTLVLVGSPHGKYTEDGKALLKSVFKWQMGCVSILGAHEWRYPARRDPNRHAKHSMERNVQIYFDLVLKNKLNLEPLITDVIEPKNAAAIYQKLNKGHHDTFGVLLDWRSET